MQHLFMYIIVVIFHLHNVVKFKNNINGRFLVVL